MRKSLYTLWILGGFLVGVWCAPDVTYQQLIYLVLIAASTSLLCLTLGYTQYLPALLVACIGMALGYARYELARPVIDDTHIASYVATGQQLIAGVVVEPPDIRKTEQKLTVETVGIYTGREWKKVSGKVLISTGKYPEFSYLSRVEVVSTLEKPEDFDGFSYTRYLARYHIYAVMHDARISEVGRQSVRPVSRTLLSIKTTLEAYFNRTLPEPQASLVAGLLLGSRRSIPEDVQESLQTTGLTHIIAISGYNISLIIVVVGNLLKRMRRSLQVIITIVFICLFTVLVGASAAVVRASIMGVLGLLALHWKRTTDVTITILATASLMTLHNPFILHDDIGFQLSFSAVVGLVYIGPVISHIFQKIPALLGLKESLVLTLSAQVSSTPIILYHFSRVSLVSPLANLLIAPAVPLGMLGGFLLLMGWFLPGFFQGGIAFIAWLPIAYIVTMAHLLSRLPYASFEISEWGSGSTLLWFLCVALICFWHGRKVGSFQSGN